MYIKHTLRLSVLSLIMISFLPSTSAYAGSNMLIIPAEDHTLPTSVAPGQTVSAYYTVINNTHSIRSGYKVQGLPSSVKQNTSGTLSCANPITLAADGSCTLQLDITSAVQSNFSICKGSNCTTAAVPLNVSQSTTPPPPPPPPIQPTRVSIGSYLSTSSLKPLIYNSSDNGKSWVLNTTALPVPSNIQPAFAPSNPLSLSSVTCGTTSQAQCVMVGFYQTIDGNTAPIVYTSVNSGKTWALSASLPLPSDIPPSGGQALSLYSVACDTTGLNCTTVGNYKNDPDQFNVPVSYASTNGGKTWVITTTFPLPAASASNPNIVLQAIHCDSNGKKCTAVGNYNDPSDSTMPLAYTSSNSGTSWTLRNVPAPSNAASNPSSKLISVACDNASELSCTAVGAYFNNSDVSAPLAYATSNGGVTWAQITVPLPSAGAPVVLGGVSCDHSGLICTAVGFYPPLVSFIASPPNPLSYTSTNGGQSWILSAALPVSSGTSYVLRGVSCDNATGLQCSAVGSKIVAASPRDKTLPISYVSSNGGVTWTITNMTPPTDLSGLRSSLTRQNPKGLLGLYSVH